MFVNSLPCHVLFIEVRWHIYVYITDIVQTAAAAADCAPAAGTSSTTAKLSFADYDPDNWSDPEDDFLSDSDDSSEPDIIVETSSVSTVVSTATLQQSQQPHQQPQQSQLPHQQPHQQQPQYQAQQSNGLRRNGYQVLYLKYFY